MNPCVCALGSRFSDSAEAKCGNLLEQVMDCSLCPKEGQAVQCFIKWTETLSMIKNFLKIYRGIKCTEDKIFHMLYRHYRVRQYHIHPPRPRTCWPWKNTVNVILRKFFSCWMGISRQERIRRPCSEGFGDGMWSQKAKRTRSNSRQVVLELLVSLFTVL